MFRRLGNLAILLPCLWSLPAVYGQEVRAGITGIVTDPTGAPLAQAGVTVTNLASNLAVTTQTNVTGNYVTPFLAPGNYRLTVEATGFKRFVRENIVLQSQDRARVDVSMELGELAQNVTVRDAVSQLQTETASRSQTLANEIIANVPTQGRNPFQIAWAAAGVVKSGAWRYLRSFDIAGTTGISINGGREGQNEVLLDGISNVRAEWTVISIPTTESVQEFKVQASTYDAQYGRTSGGVITMVTKGGGNDFHGTAFEYFQNDKLNANQSELNQPQTVAGVFYPNGRKPPNHINQFGAQASGPLTIPKLFNGKNRAFWMLSWESMRQRSADPDVKQFPLMNWRQGDFSDLFNAQGQLVSIYDPFSTKADGSRTPIPGNRIPSSQLDPVAVKVLSFYPAPSSAGIGPAHINNHPYPSIWRAGFDQFVGRTDVVVNSKNNAFFRYNENPFDEFRAVVFGLNNPAEPTGNAPLLRNGRNVMMNWTSTLSPTTTFDLRFGLNRWEDAGGSTIGAGYDPKQLGIDANLVAQFRAYQFPNFQIEGYQNVGSNAVSPGIRDTYSLQPNVNKVIGRHFLKLGAEVRQYNKANAGGGYPSGIWSFNKNWTQANATRADAVSGNGLATMLLGIPSGASVQKNIDPYYRHYYYAGFVHDDWKISSKLSLNIGLRWDAESGNVERFDRQINGLDFDAASPIASKVQGLSLKGAVAFAGVNGQPRALIDTPKSALQPRIGLAYRLHDKWVVRGGYGLYYLGEDAIGSSNGFSRQTNAIVSTDGLTPYPGMKTANPFVALPGGKLLDPIGTSLGASSFLGEGVASFKRDRGLPYSHQYSFDIQRELPGSILFEIGYTGNTTRRLPVGFGLNYIPTNELARRLPNGQIDVAYYSAQVPNPMAGLIPNNAALNGATFTRPNLWYAYPQYPGTGIGAVPVGRAQFHGMNVKVTKRLSSGLSFLSSYSTGKNLRETRILNAQDFGGVTNFESTKLVKEPDQNIDTPRKFVIAGIYELPFGKGRKFAAGVPGVVNQIIGGWQFNYDVTYQKGWVVDYPNAPQNAPGSAKLSGDQTGDRWFNTSLWKTASGTPVPTQEPFTLRAFPYLFSDVRRPGYKNWDASVSKYFPIREKLRLQFRFEMVNMMNHPWFADIASTDVTNAQFGRLNPTQRNLPRFIKLVMHLNW
ncbi:MAG: carboxypeptidase regulatory-like domain-containing protein [Acidobacteria bacterium]|nr:carboxypeptidase regulatory-like domain-containing protein [Acidobacteriota bacterium]